ncbi:putative Phospho-2-dehydro-3-deoxyheptonate aldolase [Seiridium unicorne]|uniref:Phospho-2-dehydro-3-deoxyheptonate aldolase n=1 Tax=Seiridium unicorne TaxID=138068 RepID=A0ABR2UFL5_9PEZI
MVLSPTGMRLTPAAVKAGLPLVKDIHDQVTSGRKAVKQLLTDPRKDGRLLVMVGPCSIHDVDAALDYSQRLAEAAHKHRNELLIVMRVYIEKPRTTVGWKGFVHDPDLTQSTESNLVNGVPLSREIMLRIAGIGLPVVTELLSPLLEPFIKDLLSVGIIGARTTESQTHRELSSDMPMPVGFKNGTDGALKPAIDAMIASAQPHTILSVDNEGSLTARVSSGNPDTFVVLRGGSNGPNYSGGHVREAETALRGSGYGARVIIDCSHGNSSKDYRNQGKVAASIAEQIAAGSDILGLMIESNIHPGMYNLLSFPAFFLFASATAVDIPKSPHDGLKYGVSITDGCIGWEETEVILDSLAHAARQRQLARQQLLVANLLPSAPFQREFVLNEKMGNAVVVARDIIEDTY